MKEKIKGRPGYCENKPEETACLKVQKGEKGERCRTNCRFAKNYKGEK